MIETSISNGELARRWDVVRRMMSDQQLDVVVMQNNNDWLGGYVKWFTDIPAMNAYPRTVLFFADELMTVIEMGAFGGRRLCDGLDTIYRGVGEILTTPSFGSIHYTKAYDADLVVQVLRSRDCKRSAM